MWCACYQKTREKHSYTSQPVIKTAAKVHHRCHCYAYTNSLDNVAFTKENMIINIRSHQHQSKVGWKQVNKNNTQKPLKSKYFLQDSTHPSSTNKSKMTKKWITRKRRKISSIFNLSVFSYIKHIKYIYIWACAKRCSQQHLYLWTCADPHG